MAKFKEILNGDTPVLVDFFADWCGPCQTMNPIVSELAVDLKGSVKILKVNIDKNQAVSTSFKVRGVPTFILFKGGKEVWRGSGAMPKSELSSKMKPYL